MRENGNLRPHSGLNLFWTQEGIQGLKSSRRGARTAGRAGAGADLKQSLPAGPDRAGKGGPETRGAHASRTRARWARGVPATSSDAQPSGTESRQRPSCGRGRESPTRAARAPRPARLEAASGPSFVCCPGRDPLPSPRSLPPPDGLGEPRTPLPASCPGRLAEGRARSRHP